MRHIIDSNMAVITFETFNPAPSEPTDRYSYYVEYKDVADKPLIICHYRVVMTDHLIQLIT
jgi:hypothetical protein